MAHDRAAYQAANADRIPLTRIGHYWAAGDPRPAAGGQPLLPRVDLAEHQSPEHVRFAIAIEDITASNGHPWVSTDCLKVT